MKIFISDGMMLNLNVIVVKKNYIERVVEMNDKANDLKDRVNIYG